MLVACHSNFSYPANDMATYKGHFGPLKYQLGQVNNTVGIGDGPLVFTCDWDSPTCKPKWVCLFVIRVHPHVDSSGPCRCQQIQMEKICDRFC